MKIIGITGGIGSGKSTVAAYLKEKGASVVDADAIANEVINEPSVQKELISEFGDVIKDEKGGIDRKKLAGLVFAEKNKIKKLNEIMHKYIVQKILNRIAELKKDPNVGLIAIDAAIPVEHGFLDLCDEVWAVVADREKRLSRIADKGKLSRQDAIARMDAQLSDDEYMNISDKVIINNEDLYELKIEVAEMLLNIFK